MRFICFMPPCSARSGTPGRSFLNASYANRTCLHVDRNTIVLQLRCVLMNDHSTSIFWAASTTAYACCSFSGVGASASACTARYSGSCSDRRARSLTLLVCVAENSMVCRPSLLRGRWPMIASRVAAKPMSRMRSASSSTSTLRLDASKPGVSSMCCSRRPGVATRMFIRVMDAASSRTFLPPMSSPADRSCDTPIFLSSSKICSASSRVGVSTSPPRPS
mmetsp:Transcript_19945/g.50598  ORF Transcript_19945/g.50598 Transcript_19945/m.50598 type:complete len:220 (+) Transcript_19945:463-1122(+)